MRAHPITGLVLVLVSKTPIADYEDEDEHDALPLFVAKRCSQSELFARLRQRFNRTNMNPKKIAPQAFTPQV